MQKSCQNCQQDFEITDEDLKFYEKVSPVFGAVETLHCNVSTKIPPPTFCPDCRQQRRLATRNEKSLYNGVCNLCAKNIITIYSPDKNYIIYCPNCWYSDKWESLEYGKSFDFNRGFFEQYADLQKSVPKLSVINRNSENSDYANDADHNKNCYLIFASGENEDCYYSNTIVNCKDIVDSNWCLYSELSYELTSCDHAFSSQFCFHCKNITDCYFCVDCSNCESCFGCFALKNKKYYIFNQKYKKEEYYEKLKELLEMKKTYTGLQKLKIDISKMFLSYPRKASYFTNTEDSSGDFLVNCSRCYDAYGMVNAQDCKFIHDSYDLVMCGGFGENCELLYEAQTCLYGSRNLFSIFCWNSNDIYYSEYCFNCSDCFGCVGLSRKKYCILNKQYTKEEYEKLVPKIIEHMQRTPQPPLSRGQEKSPPDKGDLGGLHPEWGEFFPSSISPFGYNETVAQEYFPMTREQIVMDANLGIQQFKWSDYTPDPPKVSKIIPANLLPENIKDIPDDILNWAIECEKTKKPFLIQKPELEFYRKMNLPIPHLHPDERHKIRMAQRNPRKLYDRKCMRCEASMKTTYSPNRLEIVYCEGCYLKEVY